MSAAKNGQTNYTTPRALAVRTEVPFDKDILKFLLEHRDQITSKTVQDFVSRYIAWLDKCMAETSEVGLAGTKTLKRLQLDQMSYGYYPSDVAYWFSKLNQLFFMLMGNAYIRINHPGIEQGLPPLNTHLSLELLSGLSVPLGFSVLVRYFQTDAHTQDKAWIDRACDLFGEFRDLETWRPDQETIEQSGNIRMLVNALASPEEPFYYGASRPQAPHPPYPSNYKSPRVAQQYDNQYHAPAYLAGDKGGYWRAVREISFNFNNTGVIIEAERRRLVDFLKSLRQTLDILNDDPLLVESQWEVQAKPQTSANGHNAGEV